MLCCIAALTVARPLGSPGPVLRDFEAYYSAGGTALHGGNPYGADIWDVERTIPGVNARRPELLPFVGPPATVPFWRIIARLPYAVALRVWQMLLGLCALAVLSFCALLLCLRVRDVATVLALGVFALAFGPLTSALALGQAALPALALALASFAMLERRPILAAACGMLSFAQPNVAVALLAQLGSRRGVLVFVLAVGAFIAVCFACEPDATLHYAGLIHEHNAAELFSSIQLSPSAVAYGFGVPPTIAAAVGDVIAAAAALFWLVRVRVMEDATARLAATCALLPLAMPFFHEHDLIVALLPALAIAFRQTGGVSTLAIFGCSVDWLGLAQRPNGLAQTLLLAFAMAGALVTLRTRTPEKHGGMSSTLLAAAGAVMAVLVLGLIVARHPLGVWPDAMAPFHPDWNAGVAHLWHQEQTATGLFNPSPLTALLRTLPLVSCATLAFALQDARRLQSRR